MDLTLKVWRQKNAKAKGHFETYQVKNISEGSSFLEMLDILNEQLVQEGIDPVAVEKGCQSSGPVSFDHHCREGICGTCEVGMVSGKAEHRDLVMSEKEKRENNSLMTCVSRGACGSKLVLDI